MNSYVTSLLTDLYQITMSYAYFQAGKHNDHAIFDLFFRKNPFKGEYTIFAGLDDCLKFVENFKFTENDINYLKSIMPANVEDNFYAYLRNIDCSQIQIRAVPEGSVVFPRVPLIIVEGPVAVCQLLETTLLNLVNYASLITTNAVRCRLAAGKTKELLEFGLRRAQGPDGAVSASKYAYIGGFDGTSNVLAGKLFGIPVRGTHAHSYVSSFEKFDLDVAKYLKETTSGNQTSVNFTSITIQFRQEIIKRVLTNIILEEVNGGELAAFISYAVSFPNDFLALVDTYDVLRSGIVNFCACALALNSLGYRPIGIRIDSGDLAYLSREIRNIFQRVANEFKVPNLSSLKIVASNDLNEDTIYSLNEQRHEIDCFAIGTHLVTCQKQPALGCVYKLVELNGQARMKLSEEIEKLVIPAKKQCFRLFGKDGCSINDIMTLSSITTPEKGKAILCRHPFLVAKRAYVVPATVQPLHVLYWSEGKLAIDRRESLLEVRNRVNYSMHHLRADIKRRLNPTPYKVSVGESLYTFLHQLWQEKAPIGRLE